MHTDVLIEAPLPPDWPMSSITISVLFTKESSGQWCARALDMDLEAYGPTREAAGRSLMDMCIVQLVFAIQKKNAGLVMRPAPGEYWQLFTQAKNKMMQRMITGDESEHEVDTDVASMPIPAAMLADYQRRKPFKRQHAA